MYYVCDQIQKNEIGGACSTYGWEESCIQDTGGEAWGWDHLEDLGVDGRNHKRIWTGGVISWMR